jgi:Fusaric acid resistance protein-like
MAAQTAVAALATYAVVRFAGMAEGTWAVISALFVVQQSVGGTVGAALARAGGTVLGTLFGLACVLLIGHSEVRAGVSLLLAASTLTFVAALVHPGLRYGVVVAAIMILGPGGDVVESAWDRAAAIGLGTVLGALASVLVFPAPAHRDAEERLGHALRRCGDLLATGIAGLTGDAAGGGSNANEGETSAIHDDILDDLEAARGMALQSYYPRLRRLRRRAPTPPPGDLLFAVERLWHTLIMVDRTDRGPLPDGPRQDLGPALRGMADTSRAYLRALGTFVGRGGGTPPPPDRVRERLAVLDRALADLRRRRVTLPLPSGEAERVFALSFAMGELARNLDEVVGLFAPGAGPRPADAAPGAAGLDAPRSD